MRSRNRLRRPYAGLSRKDSDKSSTMAYKRSLPVMRQSSPVYVLASDEGSETVAQDQTTFVSLRHTGSFLLWQNYTDGGTDVLPLPNVLHCNTKRQQRRLLLDIVVSAVKKDPVFSEIFRLDLAGSYRRTSAGGPSVSTELTWLSGAFSFPCSSDPGSTTAAPWVAQLRATLRS